MGITSGNVTTSGSGQNIALGNSTLSALTTGNNNIAIGYLSSNGITSGNFNTSMGAGSLQINSLASNNTAIGYQAMTTSGNAASSNTALGSQALVNLTAGSTNIAIGAGAGGTLTTGNGNIYINANAAASGEAATTRIGTSQTRCFIAGISNTVPATATPVVINSSGQLGSSATISLTDAVVNGNLVLTTNPSTSTAGNILKGSSSFIHNFGTSNTFVGVTAGNFTTSGTGQNSALGTNALVANTTGANNVACGYNSLNSCTTGSSNIAVGSGSGATLTTGSNNIYVGSSAATATENTTTRIGTSQTQCFIAGIRGVTTGAADAIAVLIDSTGQLGTISSSQNVKHDIEDMNDESKNILTLRPVTFIYNNDESNTKQYGLIAEEVDKVFPAIVVKNAEGKPETIQYHVLPVLLLNEMKKQQKIIEEMKQNYITKEEINVAINNLQAELQIFIIKILQNYFLHDIKKDSC
jgi:hypothetical protein